jgi:hypothetical protein
LHTGVSKSTAHTVLATKIYRVFHINVTHETFGKKEKNSKYDHRYLRLLMWDTFWCESRSSHMSERSGLLILGWLLRIKNLVAASGFKLETMSHSYTRFNLARHTTQILMKQLVVQPICSLFCPTCFSPYFSRHFAPLSAKHLSLRNRASRTLQSSSEVSEWSSSQFVCPDLRARQTNI